MKTLDLKKQFKHLYLPSARKVEVVQVPSLKFIMVDGQIEKGSEPARSKGFESSLEAMYGIAYTLKFMLKKRKPNPVDYPVMALEGLWWVRGGTFDIAKKDNWLYTLMILVPDLITQTLFHEAAEQLRRKKGNNSVIEKLRLATFQEGLCMQVMHLGPYSAEPATVQRMRAFAEENGYRDRVGPRGKHHEIYLGDPRRASPSKLKTVLRHPIERLR